MKKINFLFFVFCLSIFLQNCKTQSSKSTQPENINQQRDTPKVAGEFGFQLNNDGTASGGGSMQVPRELATVGVPASGNTNSISQESQSVVEGFSLASDDMMTSDGVEQILVSCFRSDSKFIANDWFFSAKLYSGGEEIKSYGRQNIDKCNEMQIDLKTLDSRKLYEVEGYFFWENPANPKETIVWYQGKTKQFKPSDSNITLVLEKLIQDQRVNVEIKKGEKDTCIDRNYLWNGERCIDAFSPMSFAYTDSTDRTNAASTLRAMCLSAQNNAKASIQECTGDDSQLIQPNLVSVEIEGSGNEAEEFGWFLLKFGDGTCLTALGSGNKDDDDPVLERRECKQIDSGINRREDSFQLFTIVTTFSGDQGYRNSFRIKNGGYKSSFCISVPPMEGTDFPPLAPGVFIRLSKCESQNPNTVRSQFVRLDDAF